MNTHTMRHLGTEGDYHEFYCDTCHRHIKLHVNPREADDADDALVVLNEGDVHAEHSGGIGGIAVTGFKALDTDDVRAQRIIDEALDDDESGVS